MTEITVEIQMPASFRQLGFDRAEIQRRVIEWLVLAAFTEGRISSGKAARLLNITRVEFLALLSARGVAYVNYTPEELAEEFAAVDDLKVQGAP
jgi:predicted HTH domain antitoxin